MPAPTLTVVPYGELTCQHFSIGLTIAPTSEGCGFPVHLREFQYRVPPFLRYPRTADRPPALITGPNFLPPGVQGRAGVNLEVCTGSTP